jgi:hypothetical protein
MASERTEIVRTLRQALAAVDDAQIPEELRATAFDKAVDLVRAGSGGQGSADSILRQSHVAAEQEDGSRLRRIASRLGVHEELLENVYDAGHDELQLVMPRSKLPSQKGPAMRMLALISAAGRQAGGYDPEWTTSDRIREECRQFGVLDSANFSARLAEADDVFVVRGGAKDREFKVTRHGFEEAGKVIARLIGPR